MNSLRYYDDKELLQLLQSNDEQAFSEIYNRYWQPLFIVANNRLKNEMEAEDAVEDVFISIWKNRNNLDINYSLKTYLSVSVKHNVFRRISQEYLKSNKLKTFSALQKNEGSDTTSLWIDAKELEEQLNSCIDLLPPKCKITFLKSRMEDKPYALIADEMNVSLKTVEGHITKALRILKGLITFSF